MHQSWHISNPRNPEKSQTSLPRAVWGPHNPGPPKSQKKKVRKVKKSPEINYFPDFSDVFFVVVQSGGWGGVGRRGGGRRGGGGVPNSSWETILRLFGISGSLSAGSSLILLVTCCLLTIIREARPVAKAPHKFPMLVLALGNAVLPSKNASLIRKSWGPQTPH